MSASPMKDSQGMKDHRHQQHRIFMQWPWLLVVAAWVVLVLSTLTHQTFLLDHHYLLEDSGLPWLAALEIFLLCWQVMTVAMMLPASMPMVKLIADAGRRQARPVAVPMAFLAGYGTIWTAFAAAAFLGDSMVHRLVDFWPWLANHPWIIGALTFAVAGLFQLSPLKERSLKRCRVPLEVFRPAHCEGVGPAWHLGVHYGSYSLYCCWALMLLMFGVGVGNLPGMVALTAVMVIEQIIPGGRRLSSLIGIVLLLLGLIWLAHPIWLHSAEI